ncbi:hypothetical protein Syun_014934 [Stephania yunnanensis]|uniref:RRM domain-containing protein n=1 Tax=Stephania yunnanensis TaxID=152371 RepID=A0AAP0JKR6_9MAGN
MAREIMEPALHGRGTGDLLEENITLKVGPSVSKLYDPTLKAVVVTCTEELAYQQAKEADNLLQKGVYLGNSSNPSTQFMESDLGKLFICGISWDTNEDRLKDYFQNFGEVVEVCDHEGQDHGRARGFGFVIFADPAVAERVVMEKHQIDGRTVEAKKAVPRDDQHILNRNSSSIHGSPCPSRTKKIFVGGLASTQNGESEFKRYFDRFGTITDVVVMYDHNNQRPRGFGFITYDSEDAVEKVLL